MIEWRETRFRICRFILTKTPCFAGFSTLLFGRAKRSAQAVLQRRRTQLHEASVGGISARLAEEIPPELLGRDASTKRRRVDSREATFRGCLTQVRAEEGSCARVVARIQSWHRQMKRPVPNANIARFVGTRQRLPESKAKNKGTCHHILLLSAFRVL